MIVTTYNFAKTLTHLRKQHILALDTETTGLRPYHGHRIFSLAIADEDNCYYFNFMAYAHAEKRHILTEEHWEELADLFQGKKDRIWFLHNAKFDMAMLAQEGIALNGIIHCTRAQGRVIDNTKLSYSLDELGTEIGYPKDKTIEEYIAHHKLYKKIDVPGKKTKVTEKYYHQVPMEMMEPYAERDVEITYRLGVYQCKEIIDQDNRGQMKWPKVAKVMANERAFTRTAFEMEYQGVLVDLEYSEKAAEYETKRHERLVEEFSEEVGDKFVDSAKFLARIFESEKDKWTYTQKNNPSFTSEAIKYFKNPLAKKLVELRDAKSRANFYLGFLYHADDEGFLHANLNQSGTASGRCSSSDPNLQNLKKEEKEALKKEFVIRRAIIPRPDYFFFMPDYSQMEYRLMLDYGGNDEIVNMIIGGLDVHQATANRAGIDRSPAKNANFATLYGAGLPKLALMLNCTVAEARNIRDLIFQAAPGMPKFIRNCIRTAEQRGFVFNWFGRRCHFPDPRFSYRAPNYVIQGGCADIMKLVMNRIREFLLKNKLKTKMILQIHDELVFEVHKSEIWVCEVILKMMEDAYVYRYLPLKVDPEYSYKNLADKEGGLPEDGTKTRDEVSDSSAIEDRTNPPSEAIFDSTESFAGAP